MEDGQFGPRGRIGRGCCARAFFHEPVEQHVYGDAILTSFAFDAASVSVEISRLIRRLPL